jgi:4-amino-4-deoxy-L-arabinose transferase-like glycosyltransferase
LPTRFTQIAAPPERPLPLWVLYPVFFVGVYLAHRTLLRLPWFWDEAGYYIPAALDFFRTGALIPHSVLSNAHPPLPFILLAAWWRIAGLSIEGTRTFLCMVAAAALLGVFRLARLLAGTAVAVATTALTALYPIWFAQSSLAHADLFAAAFSLWALSFYFQPFSLLPSSVLPVPSGRTNLPAVAMLFSLAALAKETAIVTSIALALWELAALIDRRDTRTRLVKAAALAIPILPLAAWYAYHLHVTGFLFGNPEFLRYNASANLTPARILLSLWHRFVHLFVHMNMFVPVVATLAVLPIPARSVPRTDLQLPVLEPATLRTVGIVVVANALAFSVLGGALLTRYLLPIYPLILLVCVSVWRQRVRWWPALAALSAVAFVLALTLNPPYSFAPEDNLTYRDFVTLHQLAIHVIATDFPEATVLTAWPATTELEHPELGYVRTPIATVALDNFSPDQIEKAALDPAAFDTALVFSTKWVPPAGALSLIGHTESTDTRFFDFHRDLTPRQVATILHGEVVWQASSHGEWAAILRFPRASQASNSLGADARNQAGAQKWCNSEVFDGSSCSKPKPSALKNIGKK